MADIASWLLAIDTATSRVVVAAGHPDGRLIAERAFPAEHRHGERLLATIDELERSAGVDVETLAGVVVGTGPGAFTGLRVGLATAKTLAHELGVPIAGVSTAAALLVASGDGASTVRVPAGPNEQVVVRSGEAPELRPNAAADLRGDPGSGTIAVDLAGRADAAAVERGRRALDGLGPALLHLGVERLARGGDDPERLVPEYVSLPRGVPAGTDLDGGVAWSRDRR